MYGMLGDIDHDVTRALFMKHGIEIGEIDFQEDGTQVELLSIRKEYTHQDQVFVITCRADGKIDDALLEIKGTGAFPYDWLKKTYLQHGMKGVLTRIKEKHPKWYYQMQVSMLLTDTKRCYLVVKDRATGTLGLEGPDGSRTGIWIDFDPDVVERILNRFAAIKRGLDANTPPLPEYTAGSRDCGFCDFRYRCHDADDRKAKGLEPAILYPGPQFEENHEREAD
jgi:hypothetical protein